VNQTGRTTANSSLASVIMAETYLTRRRVGAEEALTQVLRSSASLREIICFVIFGVLLPPKPFVDLPPNSGGSSHWGCERENGVPP
jgi:hypothetical protein